MKYILLISLTILSFPTVNASSQEMDLCDDNLENAHSTITHDVEHMDTSEEEDFENLPSEFQDVEHMNIEDENHENHLLTTSYGGVHMDTAEDSVEECNEELNSIEEAFKASNNWATDSLVSSLEKLELNDITNKRGIAGGELRINKKKSLGSPEKKKVCTPKKGKLKPARLKYSSKIGYNLFEIKKIAGKKKLSKSIKARAKLNALKPFNRK